MSKQTQLVEILTDLQFVKVESMLILGAILLLVAGLINRSNLVVKTVFAVVLGLSFYFNWVGFEYGLALSDGIFLGSGSRGFTFVFILVGILILMYSRSRKHAVEFYFFVLSIIIGSIFLIKSNSFLMIYLSLELTSIVAYLLTNFSFKKEGHEAGIKYLLFGAVSSAIMLFGFGIVYGTTHTFYCHEWNAIMFDEMLPKVGLLFVLFGLLFKASIVPFHIWVPATYQSAPNDAVAVLSIVPKLAGLVLLQRIIGLAGTEWFIGLILSLGILTILMGTFSALRQSNARRMISLGSIAHSGFLLPLVLIGSETSNQAFWWYSVVYAIMNLAVFYLLDVFENRKIIKLDEYAGLGSKMGIVAIGYTVVMISLVGIPPLAGFTAKFFLFSTLWETYSVGGNSIVLTYLLVAVFATIVSLFFYLKIPYQLFLVKSTTSQSIDLPFSAKFVATLFTIVLLLLFFVPQTITVMQQLLNQTTP